MKDQKISVKLAIGFGSILAMFVVSVIFGIVNLRSIAKNLTTFYNGPYANVSEVLQADRESEAAAKYMLRACLETDTATTSEMLKLAQDRLDLMDGYAEFLMNNYSGDKADIEKLKSEMNELDAALVEYQNRCRVNDVEGAYAIYTAQVVDLLSNITDSVNAIINHAGEYASQAHESGVRSSEITTVVMIVIGVLAVIVGVMLALYITRSITSAVRQLETAAQQMSEGDFELKVQYRSKDELGKLSDAMRSTAETLKIVIRDIGGMLHEMAGGNLIVHTQAEESYKGELGDP